MGLHRVSFFFIHRANQVSFMTAGCSDVGIGTAEPSMYRDCRMSPIRCAILMD